MAKSKEKFIEKFKKSLGNISVACEGSNISRQTFYNWKNDDDIFAKTIDDIQERNIDFAETKLIDAVRQGKTAELLFYLKTKGKHRGYYEQSSMDITSGGNTFKKIEIEIIDKENDNTNKGD
jgi:hypothetical protein